MSHPDNATEHYEIRWRGLTVHVTYDRHAFGWPCEDYPVSHVQVANALQRGPIPVSETGYKSLFLPFGEVETCGGVVAYVTRWLDAAALKPEWKATERDLRQGRLF